MAIADRWYMVVVAKKIQAREHFAGLTRRDAAYDHMRFARQSRFAISHIKGWRDGRVVPLHTMARFLLQTRDARVCQHPHQVSRRNAA